jgi:hypothetical protein
MGSLGSAGSIGSAGSGEGMISVLPSSGMNGEGQGMHSPGHGRQQVGW